MRRFLAFCLSLAMVAGFTPATALAADEYQPISRTSVTEPLSKTDSSLTNVAEPLSTNEGSLTNVAEPLSTNEGSLTDVAEPISATEDSLTDVGTPGDTTENAALATGVDTESDSADAPEGDTGDNAEGDGEGSDTPVPDVARVEAVVAPDEKSVTITATGGAFATAESVTFKTWSAAGGQDDLVDHGTRQLADGSWQAKIFIAATPPTVPGVPYNGRIPNAVHRVYNQYSGEHLYTADTNEADALSRAGWNYEGVAWVTPDLTVSTNAVEDDTTASDADTPTVDNDATTPDADNPAPDTDNPVEEGDTPGDDTPADGDEPTTPAPNPKPEQPAPAAQNVYRLYNPGNGEHLYTVDANEYRVLPAYGWRQEGVKLVSDPAQSVPIYRLHNPATGTHLYTIDRNEYNTLPRYGWNQERVAFYGAAMNADATWSATGWAKTHASAGAYTIEAWGVPGATQETPAPETAPAATARQTLMGTATFTISTPKAATVRTENINNAKGTFDIVVGGITSTSGVAKVLVPTWTQPNQSDIHWYEAKPEPGGQWRATVNAAEYGLAHNYTVHAYVVAGNGVQTNVGRTSAALDLSNYLLIAGGPYSYTVGLYNPGNVSWVTFDVWSLENGKDDVHIYNAERQSDGWWTATVQTYRLRSAGTIQIDAFSDNTQRNTTTMTIEPWQLIEQKYANMSERISNLASPSKYLIAIDNARCFIGIYEGSQGNWRNVVWWDCVVGAPWSPTVRGLFSVGSRGPSFGAGYTCYWWTQFYGDYLFHSILYNQGTYNVQDGSMGVQASHGCVRLWIDRAKWIYDNIPRGTTVLSF